MAGKRKRYDDVFRASAVVMLEAAGYPEQKGALTRVAAELKMHERTLSRWFHREQNPAPDNLVSNKKAELADIFEDVARKYLGHASRVDVIEDVAGNTAVIAAATAVDKMRLLRGLPTEIIGLMPALIEALQAADMDPVTTFERMIQRAKQKAHGGVLRPD